MVNEFPKMEVNLGQIDGRESFSFEDLFELPEHEVGPLKCEIRVQADVTSMGSRYLLDAEVECDIHGECSRCLKDCVTKLSTGFDIIFQRSGGDEASGAGGEGDYVLLSSEEEYCCDIFPRVKESVLLNIPMKILCRKECKGLCPVCGNDLNIEECGCEREQTDPRWVALDKLKNSGKR
ncbi:MAG TPA: DUF177 domain-containing protein [Candidatus Krumholzibacteriaceae bacterium]|nr:DUF177 domain-containing protein [Candidatus Krumholzibacteriaceae bacterium]